MFAVIYCPDDKSLVVVGEKSKKLTLLGNFKEKECVKLTWRKSIYDGTIVKTGDEESLTLYAKKANSNILRISHNKAHSEILELLYSFEIQSRQDVRKRIPKCQSSTKESVSGQLETNPTVPQDAGATTESDLLNQFNNSVSDEVQQFTSPVSEEVQLVDLESERQTQAKSRTKQRLSFGTPLTSTWSLCHGKPPTPPKEVLQFFRALGNRHVQDYISVFLQFYEDVSYSEQQEELMTNDMDDIVPPSPQHNTSQSSFTLKHMQPLSNQEPQITQLITPQLNKESHIAPLIQSQSNQATHLTPLLPFQPLSYEPAHITQEGNRSTHMIQSEEYMSTQMTSPLTQSLHSASHLETQANQSSNITPFISSHPCNSQQMPQLISQQSTHMTQNASNMTTPFFSPSQQPNSHFETNYHTNSTPQQFQMPMQSSSEQSTYSQITPVRRSPRKLTSMSSEGADSNGMVRLLAKSDIKVDYKQLRKATKAATEATCTKAGYKLASKLVKLIFSTQELSMSCGQGMRVKKGDLRPALDAQRIDVLKEYVTAWCRKNNKGTPKDTDINDAVTEQISYARKLHRKK